MKRQRPPLNAVGQLFRVGYWLGVIGLGASVALSATLGALARHDVDEGSRAPVTVTPSSPEGTACGRALLGHYEELVRRAGDTFFGVGGAEVLAPGADWSGGWRQEMNVTRSRCRLDEADSMRSLRSLANDLERLHLAYETALRGFQDVGRQPLRRAHALFEQLGLRPPSR